MKLIVVGLCGFMFAALLLHMGYGIETWEFWAAVGLTCIPIGLVGRRAR